MASTIYTQLDHLSLRPPTKIIHTTYAGWPQSKRKNPRVFHSHKLTFPHDITTKSKCNNDLHRGSFHINSSNTTAPSVLADIYWAISLLPEITVILFTQSTAILHKYLYDELKLFVTIFPWGCTEFPEFFTSIEIRAFQVFQVCGHPGICTQTTMITSNRATLTLFNSYLNQRQMFRAFRQNEDVLQSVFVTTRHKRSFTTSPHNDSKKQQPTSFYGKLQYYYYYYYYNHLTASFPGQPG